MIILLIFIFLVVCISATFSFMIFRREQKNIDDLTRIVNELRALSSRMYDASSELKQTTEAVVKKEETKLIFVNPYMRHKHK